VHETSETLVVPLGNQSINQSVNHLFISTILGTDSLNSVDVPLTNFQNDN